MSRKSTRLVFVVLFICAALGGLILHNQAAWKQNRENMTAQNSADGQSSSSADEVAAPTQDPETTDSSSKTPGSIQAASQGSPAPGQSGKAGEAGQSSVAPVESSPQPAAPQQSSPAGDDSLRGQLELQYISQLQSIASGYEAKLNALVATAASEYKSVKNADPNADLTPLASKYFAAGKALEAECDAQMYPLLEAFENDLGANSFPVDKAVQARETYEASKSARAGTITSDKP
ncbi:MAG: hypothetical protein PHV56_06280 [Clostridia bacterium]|nr:hypothetical protein [Clostridia bacterium]